MTTYSPRMPTALYLHEREGWYPADAPDPYEGGNTFSSSGFMGLTHDLLEHPSLDGILHVEEEAFAFGVMTATRPLATVRFQSSDWPGGPKREHTFDWHGHNFTLGEELGKLHSGQMLWDWTEDGGIPSAVPAEVMGPDAIDLSGDFREGLIEGLSESFAHDDGEGPPLAFVELVADGLLPWVQLGARQAVTFWGNGDVNQARAFAGNTFGALNDALMALARSAVGKHSQMPLDEWGNGELLDLAVSSRLDWSDNKLSRDGSWLITARLMDPRECIATEPDDSDPDYDPMADVPICTGCEMCELRVVS